jgi:hypothetical protein
MFLCPAVICYMWSPDVTSCAGVGVLVSVHLVIRSMNWVLSTLSLSLKNKETGSVMSPFKSVVLCGCDISDKSMICLVVQGIC